MVKVLFVTLFMVGCASMQPTPKAISRAKAEGKLRDCLYQTHSTVADYDCIRGSRRYCKSQGLESDCGEDWLWIKGHGR